MIETSGENQTLQQLLSRTQQGRAILSKLQGIDNEYPEFMGAFLPGLKKIVKKIGKFTSPITTKIAKVAARVVGIPPSAIDALAKVDPTAAHSLTAQLAKTTAAQALAPIVQQEITPAPAGRFKIKPLHIGLAAGSAAALVIIILLLKKRKKRA